MSVFDVKLSEGNVSTVINEYLDKHYKLRQQLMNDQELKNDAKIGRLENLTEDYRLQLMPKVEEFVNNFELTSDELELRYKKECLAHKPITTMEEILYYSKVNWFRDVLKTMTADDIFLLYENEVEDWKIACMELVVGDILKFRKDSKYARFNEVVKRNQNNRISSGLATDLELMREHKKLYVFAKERFTPDLQTIGKVEALSLYTWLSLYGLVTGKPKNQLITSNEVREALSTNLYNRTKV